MCSFRFVVVVVVVCFALHVLDAESKSTKECRSLKHDDKAENDESTERHHEHHVTDWDDESGPDVDEFSHLYDNTTKAEDANEEDWEYTTPASDDTDVSWSNLSDGDDDNSSFKDNSTDSINRPENNYQNITQTDAIISNATHSDTQSSDLQNSISSQNNAETNATTLNATQNGTPQIGNSLNSTSSENTTEQGTKTSTGYWIPIFNFGNDFYLGTNKGYAKLVNFPAPIIYSFLPVGAKETSFYGGPAMGEPRQNDFGDSTGSYFNTEPNFSNCYVNMELGNMIPYSYFGNWVAVFNFENGWNLQTYEGFVPMDMGGFEIPLTYEFDPVPYRYTSVPAAVEQQSQNGDPGLALWNNPVVMEN